MFRRVKVVPIPLTGLYRASYKKYAAYGRTPKEAVDRVSRRYHRNKFSVRNVLNAFGLALLPYP